MLGLLKAEVYQDHYLRAVAGTGVILWLPIQGSHLAGCDEDEARTLGVLLCRSALFFNYKTTSSTSAATRKRATGVGSRDDQVGALVVEHLARCPKTVTSLFPYWACRARHRKRMSTAQQLAFVVQEPCCLLAYTNCSLRKF